MNGPPDDIDALRAAFAAREAAEAPRGCPDAERLWEAARDGLTAAERREIVAHTVTCPACAAAWRLARELGGRPAVRATSWRRWALPAAAAILVALGGVMIRARIDGPAEYRRPTTASIEPRSPEVMPRGVFVLRWSPGPEGSRYDVWVTTDTLDLVDSAVQLERPEHQVPERALAALPAGTPLRWRVELKPPHGETVRSPAFAARVD